MPEVVIEPVEIFSKAHPAPNTPRHIIITDCFVRNNRKKYKYPNKSLSWRIVNNHSINPMDKQFSDIVTLIQQSRSTAIKAVNIELINLYWNIGAYIKQKLSVSEWGDKTVDELASFIQKNNPELKGFNRRGLYRMIQFYEPMLPCNLCPQ